MTQQEQEEEEEEEEEGENVLSITYGFAVGKKSPMEFFIPKALCNKFSSTSMTSSM